jgi:Fe-Mn family superoxide dismutase
MHTLPDLAFSFDALEPYIDAQTMRIHHDLHHGAYVTNLNKALEATTSGSLLEMDLERLLRNLNEVPEAQRAAIRNNGGGHFNHSLFWSTMGPGKGGAPSGSLARAIDDQFDSFEAFKQQLEAAGMGRFGSGWAWLKVRDGALAIESTPNQDNPLMDGSGVPILGVDVWEHAYYLKYQNRRADYLKAFWNVVDWDAVARRFESTQH